MLRVHVPRHLRVRASIQLAGARVPARAFLIVAGLLFIGGLLVVGGADLIATTKLTAGLVVVGLAVFELRMWGRSTRAVARVLVQHYRRPHQLRVAPIMVTLPVEASERRPIDRAPRWRPKD